MLMARLVHPRQGSPPPSSSRLSQLTTPKTQNRSSYQLTSGEWCCRLARQGSRRRPASVQLSERTTEQVNDPPFCLKAGKRPSSTQAPVNSIPSSRPIRPLARQSAAPLPATTPPPPPQSYGWILSRLSSTTVGSSSRFGQLGDRRSQPSGLAQLMPCSASDRARAGASPPGGRRQSEPERPS